MDSFFKIVETEYVLMPTWKWFGLVLIILLFPFIRRAMSLLVVKVKNSSFVATSKNIYVIEIVKTQIENPLSWIFTLLFFISIVDIFDFPRNLSKYSILFAQILIGFRWIQLLIMSIDFVSLKWSQKFSEGDNHPNQIIPFVVKTAKVVLVILGVLITLQNLGINVASVLAGLGIGGLAIALAGQETVANLFGSLTILVDKPFKLNDHIKALDVEGIVVEIGFRSTKIKTLSNSMVFIPNSVLAKEKLENLSARPRRRIRHIITLSYETPLPTIKSFISALDTFLKGHSDIEADGVAASLTNLNNYSVDVQIVFHVKGNNPDSELIIQQEFLLYVLKTAEEMKIEIAYPTQKLFIENTLSAEARSQNRV